MQKALEEPPSIHPSTHPRNLPAQVCTHLREEESAACNCQQPDVAPEVRPKSLKASKTPPYPPSPPCVKHWLCKWVRFQGCSRQCIEHLPLNEQYRQQRVSVVVGGDRMQIGTQVGTVVIL